ncbi:MAG: hypothetical protein ABI779_25355, partial [Acidobacteriota bacterium]
AAQGQGMMQDFDSTLVRRGVHASTLTDMAGFVEMIQERAVDQLLTELPGIATLSDTKFSLARTVIRRRARKLARPDFEQLRLLAFEVADDVGGDVGERIRGLFSFS